MTRRVLRFSTKTNVIEERAIVVRDLGKLAGLRESMLHLPWLEAPAPGYCLRERPIMSLQHISLYFTVYFLIMHRWK